MKIVAGIASTTHVDRHLECLTKGALVGMEQQIRRKYIPSLMEHDRNKQMGVILYGKVFQLRDGEYALGVVTGLFENENERNKFKLGQPNEVWKNYENYLPINKLIKLIDENNKEENQRQNVSSSNKGPKLSVADLLEMHLDSTQVLPDGTIYKIKRLIAVIGGLKIEVYPKDHQPTHFHVVSKQRNINAKFDIETLALISAKENNISERNARKIQNFFKSHPTALERLRREHSRLQG